MTITWMSSIKLNTECICLGHLAGNAQSLKENRQSEHVYYCSHIINVDKKEFEAIVSKQLACMY